MLPLHDLDFSVFLTSQGWIQLLTLTALEIVLGIDNIVMISILSGELPKERQARARRLGLAFALITRILLLLTLSWMMRLVEPLFHIGSMPFTGKDLVPVSYTHLRAHETVLDLVCRLLLEKKKYNPHARTHIPVYILPLESPS